MSLQPPQLPTLRITTAEEISALTIPAFLNPKEQTLLEQKPAHHRTPWLLGRLAAKQSLAAYFQNYGQHIDLCDISIINEPTGRPRACPIVTIPTHIPKPHFSISHTNTLGAAVTTAAGDTTAVGLDIESIRSFSHQTLTAFATAEEYAYVQKLPHPHHDQTATLLWSTKEAYLKALGVGLRIHPQTIRVQLDHKTNQPISLSLSGKPTPTLVYSTILLEQSHVLSCICL